MAGRLKIWNALAGVWQYVSSVITPQAVGFTITSGTTPKTLTVTGDATISGTPITEDEVIAWTIIFGG